MDVHKIRGGGHAQRMSLQTSKKYPAPRNWKEKEFTDIQKSKAPPRTHQISNRRMTNIIGAHELSK